MNAPRSKARGFVSAPRPYTTSSKAFKIILDSRCRNNRKSHTLGTFRCARPREAARRWAAMMVQQGIVHHQERPMIAQAICEFPCGQSCQAVPARGLLCKIGSWDNLHWLLFALAVCFTYSALVRNRSKGKGWRFFCEANTTPQGWRFAEQKNTTRPLLLRRTS